MDGNLRYVKNRTEFEIINQQENGQMPAPNKRFDVRTAELRRKKSSKKSKEKVCA